MPETTPPEHEGRHGCAGVLGDRAVTVATRLRDSGCHTCITGKWHPGKTAPTLPGRRGFERSFILAGSGCDNRENRTCLMPCNKACWSEQDRESAPPRDFFSSTFFVDKAIASSASPGRAGGPSLPTSASRSTTFRSRRRGLRRAVPAPP